MRLSAAHRPAAGRHRPDVDVLRRVEVPFVVTPELAAWTIRTSLFAFSVVSFFARSRGVVLVKAIVFPSATTPPRAPLGRSGQLLCLAARQ